MRILRFANGIYPETVGGIEVNVARVSAMQADAGHDVEVHVPRPSSPSPPPPRRYKVVYYDPGPRVFGNPLSAHPYRVARERLRNVDALHGHSHLYFGSNQAAYAARRFGVPFVLTNEGMVSQTAPATVQRMFLRTVGAYTFAAASIILTYSRAEAAEMIRLGVEARKIRVITQGIDTDAYRPEPKPDEGDRRLLWISRHVPGKGADILVRAVALLRQRGVGVRATLVGEGPDRARIEALVADLGLAGSVELRDFVSEAELRRLYATSHLLVLPSISEAMNRCVLEALACGTPALTSDIPHLAELLRDCGGVARERTPTAFVEAIQGLLAEDLVALGARGRAKVLERYSWARTFQETEDAFREACHAN